MRPDPAGARTMDRAAAAFAAGRVDEAAALCAAVLREDPDHFFALHLAAAIALQRAQWTEAAALATRALAVRPLHPDVLANRGAALRRLGRHAEALADYDAVLAANPHAPGARHNRGVALAAMGRHEEAIAEYLRAVQAEPSFIEAHHNLGLSLAATNRHAEALQAHSRALALDPRHVRARWGRALALLALGHFPEGFRDYEVRHALGDPRMALREVRGPLWTGNEPIGGRTLLLVAEQGFGDTLMFCRFARALREQGARVWLAAPSALKPLLASLPLFDGVVAPDEDLPPFDLWCPLASLPARLGTRLEQLPAQSPPLAAPAEWAQRWEARLAAIPRPRIGIAWAGGLGDGSADPRALDVEAWRSLRDLPVSFVALQNRLTPRETAVLREHPAVAEFARDIADFRDTAALIANVDLVISVDTAVAHLAGAMSRPTWILLPFAADWRWLAGRDDSPWYPSATLMRQPRPGDWGSVIRRVARAIEERFGPRPGAAAANAPSRENDAALKAQVRALLAKGRADEAHAIALTAAGTREPGDAEWLHLLGAAQHLAGRHTEAIATLERAARLAPRDARVRNTLGAARLAAGDMEGARQAFDEALERDPSDAGARFNRALLLEQQGDDAAALAEFGALLALHPGHGPARLEQALVLLRAGRAADAAAILEPLLAHKPGDARVLVAAASARAAMGERDSAAALASDAARSAPEQVEVRERVGDLLASCGRSADAQAHYAFVASRRPGDGPILEKLASAAYAAGNVDRSIELLRRRVDADPGAVGAVENLAIALHETGDRDEAFEVLERALARAGDHARLLEMLAIYKASECQWAGLDGIVSRLRRVAAHQPVRPGSSLFFDGVSAAEQRRWAETWCRAQWPAPAPRAPHAARGTRLRVGFLSGDYHAHATAWLVAPMIELHDRDRFEFVAYSYSPPDATGLQDRCRNAFDRFVEIGALDDAQAAAVIRAEGIDVLLELGGHTKSGRLGVLAHRPAPLQGHYLAYPGTTGAPFVDFYVADSVALPPALEHGFSERIARMPTCYQPNGRGPAPVPDTTREQEGLPREGLVFCSFNQPVKITRLVFTRWCELLRAVPGSVLWLLEVDARATANLRREASARGIDPARLVFAPRTAIARHAARIRHADLALDTFPYGSHTTASDTIRAGVPLMTWRGATFASRVAASVLTAAGCREWVFDDAERAFEASLALARDPVLRAAARARAHAAADSALFDTRAYVRDFERLLLDVTGEAPHGFAGAGLQA